MTAASEVIEKRPRGRPKEKNPSDPFDWLRFPPAHIRAFQKEFGTNIRVPGGDWRKLNEAERRKSVGNILKRVGNEGRRLANDERAREKIRRRGQLWARWRDIIADTGLSVNKVVDILVAEGAAEAKQHRSLRRHIAELRRLQIRSAGG